MTDNDPNDLAPGKGEEALRQNRKKWWLGQLLMVALIIPLGLAVMLARKEGATEPYGSLDPVAAVLIALAMVGMLNWGTWYWLKKTDEMDRRDNLVSFTVGFFAHMSGMIAWTLLWQGGIVPSPPMAMPLFLFSAIVGLVYYLWLKIRS